MGKAAKNEGLGGAAVLAFANIVCRILGFMFKVPLSNLMGSEGMGYFSLATQIFGVATFASCGGLPVVLGRLSAARKAENKSSLPLLKSVSPLFFAAGGVFAVLMALLAEKLCVLAGVDGAVYGVWALAPAVFFVSAESMYRAYFQGRSLLAPGALAQTCEAAAKLLAGTAVVWVLFKRGYSPSVVAAGAAFGVTAGTAVAALTLRIRVFREGSLRKTLPEKDVGKRLLWESLPISAGVLAMNIIGALDAAVILNRLAFCGNSARAATSLYGIYTGYAVTVYAMPFALTGAVTAWAAPRVAGAFATGRFAAVTASLRTALRLCAGVGAFAGFCYLLMPGELLGIFFSKAEAASASPLLALLSVSVFVCPLSSVISSALQSMGKTKIPLISGIVSGGVKLVLNYVLIGIPEIGILGAPISAAASFLLSFAFCGAALSKQLKSAGERVRFLRRCAMPFFCGLMGAVSARALCGALTGCLSERFAAASAVVSGCGVFFIFALMTGVITRRELGIFGAGKKGERLDDNENREIHYG